MINSDSLAWTIYKSLMKQSSFTIYYFSIGILFIVLEKFTHSFYPEIIVKAMIIPVLMIYYHSVIWAKYNNFHRLMMTGFFFSWLGDVLLQFSNGEKEFGLATEDFFMLGLVAFLLTQVFYTIAFSTTKGKNSIFTSRIYMLILIIGYGALLLWLLYNKLVTPEGNYRVPVIIYTAVILTMLASALNRYGKVNGVSYMLVSIGAILFVASDSMIAINRFIEKFDFARILIMSTYITAQYLIAIGCLKQDYSDEQ
ncbi:MAG: lysoplasmalogenase [Bacteroidales bacterium]